MQLNVQNLAKKAINAALSQDWQSAVAINEEILASVPDDQNAKVRLGRAYLKIKKYSKAKKLFKEILERDPINKIALKNLKLATEKKEAAAELTIESNAFIKKPGTSMQMEIKIANTSVLNSLELGQELKVDVTKEKIEFSDQKTESLIGTIEKEDDLQGIIYTAVKANNPVKAKIIKIKDGSILLTLSCKTPIFKSDKQQEKPFMRLDPNDEPTVDVSSTEESS